MKRFLKNINGLIQFVKNLNAISGTKNDFVDPG